MWLLLPWNKTHGEKMTTCKPSMIKMDEAKCCKGCGFIPAASPLLQPHLWSVMKGHPVCQYKSKTMKISKDMYQHDHQWRLSSSQDGLSYRYYHKGIWYFWSQETIAQENTLNGGKMELQELHLEWNQLIKNTMSLFEILLAPELCS